MRLADLDDINLLTALLVGEAAGEPFLGKIAVAWVVRNRLTDPRWPNQWRDVMLQKQQFSCFNGLPRDDSDIPQSLMKWLFINHFNDLWWRECKYAAHGVLYHWVGDPTEKSNHYLNPKKLKVLPSWAKDNPDKLTMVIGNHDFYRL